MDRRAADVPPERRQSSKPARITRACTPGRYPCRELRDLAFAFVDPEDHERLVERARSEDRSVSAELRLAIREHLGNGERAVIYAVTAARAEEEA